MKKMLKDLSLRAIAIEISSIVAGVLIALAINEWNQNRLHRNAAEQALVKITAEIRKNRELVQKTYKNNKNIVDNFGNSGFSGEFVPALQIQDTAWQTAISTGTADHIDYETLYTLSTVYRTQEIYRSISYQTLNTVMNLTALAIATNDKIKAESDIPTNAFNANLALVVNIEKNILTIYDNALEKLTESGVIAKTPVNDPNTP